MTTTVPGILYIGGWHAQGGNPGLSAAIDGLGASNLRFLMDRTVMRITPDNASTGVPTAASLGCYPWYNADGSKTSTIYTVAASPTPTTTTCTVNGTSPGWTTNQHVGRAVTFLNTSPVAGVGFSARSIISANTANGLTFAAIGAAPTAGQSFIVGTGKFEDYHPAAGWLDLSEFGNASTRGGSTFQAGWIGVGPDATLIRYLFEKCYTSSPYFACWKWATPTGPNAGWSDTATTERTKLVAEKVFVDGAATARSWSLSWQWAIIDLSAEDLLAAVGTPTYVTTYETALRQMIAWLKTTLGNSSLKVVLVNHRDDLLSTTAALGAPLYRAAHRAIAANTSGVYIVDMLDAEAGQPTGSLIDPGVEITYYSQRSYFDMGTRIGEAIRRGNANYSPAQAAGGYPMYVMLGDSHFVGQATTTWVSGSISKAISGPSAPGSLVRPTNQKIWNKGTAAIETYTPGANSNTAGSTSSNSAEDLSIMAYLGDLHPDGFVLVKMATNSSGLNSAAVAYTGTAGGRWAKSRHENYDVLTTEIGKAKAYVNATIGKQADVKAFFVSLGHNDNSISGGGANFEAALRTFVNDLQADFGTRTGGDAAPVIWRRPQADASGTTADEIAAVRDALDAVAAENPQFLSVDVDGYERTVSDNLHETPDSAVAVGYLMCAELAKVSI